MFYFVFSCIYQVKLVFFENWMVTFRQDKCVMTLLDIPLKDLPLKGGEEEFVGIVKLLGNQALKSALLKA